MTPEIKRLLNAMADAENKSFTDILEDALRLRDQMMKGRAK